MTAVLILAALVLAALIARRFGGGRLAGGLAVLWALGCAWLALTGRLQGRAAAGWVGGGALVVGLAAYGALLARLRRRACGAGQARPGELGHPADGRPHPPAPAGSHAPDAPLPPTPARAAAITAPAAALSAPVPPAPAQARPPADPAGPLTDPELDRYARHIVLRELGGAGQRRLRAARVLVAGAGGLGAPVLQYLAAAGVGRITLADDDSVSLSNLQRQVIFATADIGRPKAVAAADALARLNPHVAVTPLLRRVTEADGELVGAHDLVLDGTDSFASRLAINAACVAASVPLIAGAIAQWEGQVALYDPARGGPCLACLFPRPPAPGLAPSCAEAGVVGALPGVIGSLMAIEAIKLAGGVVASGTGAGLRGRMLILDGLWGDTRMVSVTARPGCPVCGGRGA